jgi:hypothetical protein
VDRIELALVRIAGAFNDANICWGVGGSLLLRQYGLADTCGDIDLLVSPSSLQAADGILSAMGEKQPEKPSDVYATDCFYEYVIGGVCIDLIAGLKIRTGGGVYEHVFDENSVRHTFWIGGVAVPFTALEDWHALYRLMPGKEYRANRIANYLRRQDRR